MLLITSCEARRGLAQCNMPQPAPVLCVDEVAFKKGHKYVTVISDVHGQAPYVTDDRCYLRSQSPQQLEDIRTLSMDMNSAYIRAARFHLPAATSKIVLTTSTLPKYSVG